MLQVRQSRIPSPEAEKPQLAQQLMALNGLTAENMVKRALEWLVNLM